MLSFLQACFVITLSSGDSIFTYIYIYINKAIAERIKKKSPLTICCLFSSIPLKTDATTLFRVYCHLGKILQATSNRKSTQNI